MVIFHSTEDAEAVDKAITKLRQEGHHKREFKFSQINHRTRDAFFDAIMPRRFDIKAVIWDMHMPLHLSQPGKDVAPEFAYQVALNNLLHLGQLSNARIRLDGKISKRIRRYLKLHKDGLNVANPGTVKQIGMRDSKKDNLVQLADMVVGSIARSLDQDNRHHNRWRRKLNLKKSDLHFDI
jgi:hypothetical protein